MLDMSTDPCTHVLVVEDDPAVRDVVRRYLERDGHRVTLAADGRAALEAADKTVDQRLAAPFRADANDYIYSWESSRDYNPSPGLERIQATLLAINAADDERYPPETGVLEREMKRVKNGRLLLIPASEETRGHATTGMAKFYKKELEELLQTTPRRAM